MHVLQQIRRVLFSTTAPIARRRDRRLAEARRYVGTDEVSGRLQLELLKREGCRPASNVLEVGCGCLNAGLHLIRYLEPGRYAGLDPNEWLRASVLERRRVRRLVERKQARFASRTDFDASVFGVRFDRVLSHSVLSHCAHWQLEQFLRNVARVLAPGGRILASIRLAEGNPYGSAGTPGARSSRHREWQYPGVSWFALAEVVETAERCRLRAVHVPEYTRFYTATRPHEWHDWMVFTAAA
jgi:cyclopropane fatty-acyl-phospholipid synthase-like methyltransferase